LFPDRWTAIVALAVRQTSEALARLILLEAHVAKFTLKDRQDLAYKIPGMVLRGLVRRGHTSDDS
jgi:hypothetical protein